MTENNDQKLKKALEFIKEEKILMPGFYGEAGITFSIENGNIQDVKTLKLKKHK